jgi:thiosulfate/3-mercaptopyruvate sulfurtransferase
MSAELAPLLHGSAVVTAEWLIAHLAEVKVVDASWAMRSKKRDDFNRLRIAGAVFFDVDESSAPAPALPHTFPSAEQVCELGGVYSIGEDGVRVVGL